MEALLLISKYIYRIVDDRIILRNYKYINKVLTFLKYHTRSQYKILVDIIAIDKTNTKKRFQVIYLAKSLILQKNIFVKVLTNNNILSVKDVYDSASWSEREVYDMFGINVLNHHDLRSLLTDYGFKGFPLRKDFPLGGYTELRFSENLKKVIKENI